MARLVGGRVCKVLASLHFMAMVSMGRMASPLSRRFTVDQIQEFSLLIQSRVDSVATNLEIDGLSKELHVETTACQKKSRRRKPFRAALRRPRLIMRKRGLSGRQGRMIRQTTGNEAFTARRHGHNRGVPATHMTKKNIIT